MNWLRDTLALCCTGILAVSLTLAGSEAAGGGPERLTLPQPPPITSLAWEARLVAGESGDFSSQPGDGAGQRSVLAGEQSATPAPPLTSEGAGSKQTPEHYQLVIPYDVFAAALQAFGTAEVDAALCIAFWESRYKADAVGAGGELGVFQVHPVHGVPADELRNVYVNARVAKQLRDKSGWTPWRRAARNCGL